MIKFEQVSKIYQTGNIKTKALDHVDVEISAGDFVVILGPSGSGKSTMLNLMGGLDLPTEGNVTVDAMPISTFDEKKLVQFRRKHIGFVFQEYNLLPTLTSYENIDMAYHLSDDPLDIDTALKQVGLTKHKDKYPYELSGGEQQRVSIARALVKQPKVLFCDEPTGSLDEDIAKQILKVLQNLNQTMKTTIIVITHNTAIAQIADRVIHLNSGKIVKDIRVKTKVDPMEISFSP